MAGNDKNINNNKEFKTKYRILEKNVSPDSSEELLMYIPEYFNNYTGTWVKIHKCIKYKQKQYFLDLKEAQIACKEHAKKQPKIIWTEFL